MTCAECEELSTTHAIAFREYEMAKARYAESVLGPISPHILLEKRLLEHTMEAYAELAAIDSQLTNQRCSSWTRYLTPT